MQHFHGMFLLFSTFIVSFLMSSKKTFNKQDEILENHTVLRFLWLLSNSLCANNLKLRFARVTKLKPFLKRLVNGQTIINWEILEYIICKPHCGDHNLVALRYCLLSCYIQTERLEPVKRLCLVHCQIWSGHKEEVWSGAIFIDHVYCSCCVY